MAIENELTFADYLSIAKRRWRPMLLAYIVTVIIIIIVSLLLPPVYRSEGVISIEYPSISSDVVKTDVTNNYDDERIDKLKQRVMSKESLVSLNEKYHLLPNDPDTKKLAENISKMISVDTVTKSKSTSQWSSEKVTVAFIIGFQYSDPEVTYKVANDLVSMFLAENEKAKELRVTETSGFLTEELNRLKSDLESVENKVAAYKQSHADSLPENVQLYMTMLDQANTDLKDIDRDYKSTQEELRYLDVEYSTTSATLKSGGGVAADGTPKISELDQAKAELERAQVLYKDTHPTVRALKRKIQALEDAPEVAATPAKPAKIDVTSQLALSKIQTQIESAKSRLDSIADQKRTTLAKIAKLQSQVESVPQVERGLASLLRDYDNAKTKYDDVKAKQINAKIAGNLELGDKGERFTLLEPPVFPEYRLKPQRTKIVAMGLVGSIIVSALVAALLEMLDKRVRGVNALTSAINMRPLAIVPYISTPEEVNYHRKLKKYAYAIIVILVCAILLAAAYYYLVFKHN